MKNYSLLVLVSGIWGFSYIFMKVLSPVYGGYAVAFSRLFIGGIFLVIYCKLTNVDFEFKKNYKHYVVVSLLNCAIPLTCFSLAAIYIDASLSVIINSLSPIMASIYGIYFLNEKLSKKQVFGLLLAFFSVAYITLLKQSGVENSAFYGIILAFIAANGYALSSIYISLKAKDVNPKAIASCATFIGSLFVLPLAITTVKTLEVNYVFQFLALGILCTGIANAIYFYILKEIGIKALSTTLLQPIFGSIWAYLFLDEVFTFPMIIAIGLIIFGVYTFLKEKF